MFLIASFCLPMLRLILRSSDEALSLISSSERIHLSIFSARRGMVTINSVMELIRGSGGRSLFIKLTIRSQMRKL